MVPLNDDTLYIDMFERWQLPVVLCARTALGTINHSLLSVEALRKRRIDILGIASSARAIPKASAPSARSGRCAGWAGCRCCRRSRRTRCKRHSGIHSGAKISIHDARTQITDLAPVHAACAAWRDDVDRAQRGRYLYTADDRRIIDAIASWWVVTHGHCHPHIVRAIQEQAEQLNQIIFAGHTHDPAETVAAQLLKLAPMASTTCSSQTPARPASKWR